jgi:hypothetical protein
MMNKEEIAQAQELIDSVTQGTGELRPAQGAPPSDWPFIREQFKIEFGREMHSDYGGEIMNLMMSIRELLSKAGGQDAPQPPQLRQELRNGIKAVFDAAGVVPSESSLDRAAKIVEDRIVAAPSESPLRERLTKLVEFWRGKHTTGGIPFGDVADLLKEE